MPMPRKKATKKPTPKRLRMGMVFAFAAPAREGFLRDLRNLVPPEDRHYISAKRMWIVHPKHTHDLEDLMLHHFPDLWRRRQVQKAPRPRVQPEPMVGANPADGMDFTDFQGIFGSLLGGLFYGAARAHVDAQRERAIPAAETPAVPDPGGDPFARLSVGVDDYKALHVWPGAPLEVVKAAYLALAKLHHTDKGGDAETMKRINVAWQRIRDAEETKTDP